MWEIFTTSNPKEKNPPLMACSSTSWEVIGPPNLLIETQENETFQAV